MSAFRAAKTLTAQYLCNQETKLYSDFSGQKAHSSDINHCLLQGA